MRLIALYLLILFSFSSWSMNDECHLPDYFLSLNKDVALRISLMLDSEDLKKLPLVSKRFYLLANGNDLWQTMCQNYHSSVDKAPRDNVSYKELFFSCPRIQLARVLEHPTKFVKKILDTERYVDLRKRLISEVEERAVRLERDLGVNDSRALLLSYYVSVILRCYKIATETAMEVAYKLQSKKIDVSYEEAMLEFYETTSLCKVKNNLGKLIDNCFNFNYSPYEPESDECADEKITSSVLSFLNEAKPDEELLMMVVWRLAELCTIKSLISEDVFNKILLPLYHEASQKNDLITDEQQFVRRKKEICRKLKDHPYFSYVQKKL